MTIHGEYRLYLAEWLRVVPSLCRNLKAAYLLCIVALVFPIISVPVAAVPFLVLAVLFATGLLSLPGTWLSMRRQRAIFEAPQSLDATPDELHVSSAYADATYKWSVFRSDGRELPTMFALRTSGGTYFVISKRAFSAADLVAFRGILEAHKLLR